MRSLSLCTMTDAQSIENEYSILLRGSARPHNGELIVEDAAKIGVEELEKTYNIDEKGYSVEMIFWMELQRRQEVGQDM